MSDPLNAFSSHNNISLQGSAEGPLSGLTFAAKDIFDVAGRVTGAGNPDWFQTHDKAEKTARAVQVLLDAGAHLNGITTCTELTRGIMGDNAHYGMPKNPRAPDRVPGGSSSGSASAVAGKVVDFALGSDTNGSITVPASFCGLFGMKPTRDRVSRDGMFKHAPRFDTVGWFARDPDTLTRVGSVLFEAEIEAKSPSHVVISADAFSLVEQPVKPALSRAIKKIERLASDVRHKDFCPVDLEDLLDAHYVIHGREAWQQFKTWFERVNPRLSFNIARAFFNGSNFSEQDETLAENFLAGIREKMFNILGDDTFVCLPSTASCAWPAVACLSEVSESVRRTAKLVTIGTSLGVPQITIPVSASEDVPIGLSILGPRGSDEALLAFSRAFAESPQ